MEAAADGDGEAVLFGVLDDGADVRGGLRLDDAVRVGGGAVEEVGGCGGAGVGGVGGEEDGDVSGLEGGDGGGEVLEGGVGGCEDEVVEEDGWREGGGLGLFLDEVEDGEFGGAEEGDCVGHSDEFDMR